MEEIVWMGTPISPEKEAKKKEETQESELDSDYSNDDDNYYDDDFYPKLMIGDLYIYNQRLFCRKSHAIENFIGKVKRYYSDKIKLRHHLIEF